jgi:hypothetical protein
MHIKSFVEDLHQKVKDVLPVIAMENNIHQSLP